MTENNTPKDGATRHEKTEDDDIVRVIGYGHKGCMNFNNAIHFSEDDLNKAPGFNQPLASTRPITTALGTLDIMPPELMGIIIGELDIESVLRFRAVNRLARSMVCALPEFRVVATHALPWLLAVIRTCLASKYTFADIQRAMLLRECEREYCHGRRGAYFYLPTGARACERCIGFAAFHPLALDLDSQPDKMYESNHGCESKSSYVAKLRGHKDLNILKTIPGEYGPRDRNYVNTWHQRFEVVDRAAMNAVRKELGIPDSLVYGSTGVNGSQADYLNRSFVQKHGMVIVPLPFLNVKTRKPVEYFACKGCAIYWLQKVDKLKLADSWGQDDAYEMEEWDWVAADYTRSQLLAHFRECEEAKDLWAVSEGGTECTRLMENEFIWKGHADVAHYDYD
jgi:hypothetical protein